MNYTGDVLNFGVAAEKGKASGIDTEFFAMADDVGVGRSKGGKVGRRGIAGSIMTLKIVGALADKGGSLAEVYKLAQQVSSNLVSLGSSLEHVHVPGRAKPGPEDEMPEGEIEVGMGIHNEPGSHKLQASLPDLIKIMLAQLLDPNDKDRAFVSISRSDNIVLFMNNLGGLSMLELAGVTAEAALQLERDYGHKPVRVISGTFLTSLNGMGFSISILRLEDTGLGPGKSMLELLDHPTEAVGWAAPVSTSTWESASTETMENKVSAAAESKPTRLTFDPSHAKNALAAGLHKVIAAEAEVTRYDTIVGDGDCGIGLKRGAEAILKELDSSASLPSDAVAFVNTIVPVIETTMDGTSGAIYAIFMNALAHGLREQDTGSEKPVDAKTWAAALVSSLKALGKYTPAQPGDRTLMDTLVPFVDALGKGENVKVAAERAREGAEKTKGMTASLGRAVYVGGESEWMGKVPDPGAWGLAEFLEGLALGCES